jgi:hypothetical protein
VPSGFDDECLLKLHFDPPNSFQSCWRSSITSFTKAGRYGLCVNNSNELFDSPPKLNSDSEDDGNNRERSPPGAQ